MSNRSILNREKIFFNPIINQKFLDKWFKNTKFF